MQENHGTRAKIRTNLTHALLRLGDEKTAQKVDSCGKYAVLECPDCRTREKVKFSCGVKLCPTCASLLRWRRVRELAPLVQSWERPRLMTLTFRNRAHLTKEWIKKQRQQLRDFLSIPYVAERVTGGLWAWEVTYNQRRKQWHPHYHIIFDGKWVDDDLIALYWHMVTGDSYIVDVREIKKKGTTSDRPATETEKMEALEETIKYICKVMDFSDDVKLIEEFLTATHRMRRIGQFGTAYGFKAAPPEPSDKRFQSIDINGHSIHKISCRCCGHTGHAEFWHKPTDKEGNPVFTLMNRKDANVFCDYRPPPPKPDIHWVDKLFQEAETNASRTLDAVPF